MAAASGAPGGPDFKKLFERSPGLYLILDPSLKIIAVTDAYLAATMTYREEILGKGIFEVFPDNPDDAEATGVHNLRASLHRVVKTRNKDAMAVQRYDIRKPSSEGGGFEIRYWSPINLPIVDEHGFIVCIIHQVEDVTEFIKSKEKERLLNQVTEELREKTGKMEIEIFQRAQEIQEINQQLRDFQAELESRVEARTIDLQLANAALKQEIEERIKTQETLKQIEEQLRHSQKMEAVGRLAGGVAHDFNNLLTVIMSYCETIATQSPSREIESIAKAARSAADLTSQLLAFSRQQVIAPKVLNLRELVLDLKEMLMRVIREDVSLKIISEKNIWPIRADANQMEQVLMNLIVNARDAMPDGGTITIEIRNTHLDESYSCRHIEIIPGDYVLLCVSDTGIGMDKETQERVFEPFFTTKPLGKGTGLGLATVFGIVKQSTGSIIIYSEPGVGTTFKIYFPAFIEKQNESRLQEEKASNKTIKISPSTHINHFCRILLVEDEDQVRAVARDALLDVGYEVLEASNAEDALKILDQTKNKIDMLLTDVIMSGMNGRRLAELIKKQHPEVITLFMSGYTDDAILRHGVLDAGVPFLQKPFTPSLLRLRVSELLRQVGGQPEDQHPSTDH